jgi:hypothetical protein
MLNASRSNRGPKAPAIAPGFYVEEGKNLNLVSLSA